MLNAYKNNPALQSEYLKLNKITHAEIWEEESGFILAICTGPGVGFPESPSFEDPSQCEQWLREHCNCKELPILQE